MNFELSIEKDCDVKDFVSKMLDDYNEKIVGPYNDKPLNIFFKDDSGNVLGGLVGITYWGWLYVDYLVVDESQRGSGIGSELLKRAEDEAVRRGCRGVHLDTHDFQAREFYKHQGYRVNSTIENLPEGHRKYQLIKELTAQQ